MSNLDVFPSPDDLRREGPSRLTCVILLAIFVLLPIVSLLFFYHAVIHPWQESERMPIRYHDLSQLDFAFRTYRSRFGDNDAISFHEVLLRSKAGGVELKLECSMCGGVFHANTRPIRDLADRTPLAWCPECGRRRDYPLVLLWISEPDPRDREQLFSLTVPRESLSDLKPLGR